MVKQARPLAWSTVRDNSGAVLGSYAVDGNMIVVHSAANGEEETTQLGGSASHPETLARAILSEARMRRPMPS